MIIGCIVLIFYNAGRGHNFLQAADTSSSSLAKASIDIFTRKDYHLYSSKTIWNIRVDSMRREDIQCKFVLMFHKKHVWGRITKKNHIVKS